MIRKNKYPCKYWRSCKDFKRSKEICHDEEFLYCYNYKILIKKEKNLENKTQI